MDFDAYDLDNDIYDEMFLSDGAPRQQYRQLHETLYRLSAEGLGTIQERVTRSFSNEGHHLHRLRGRRGRRADHPD